MMIRLLVLFLMLPGAALACACCAERGERYTYEVELGSYEKGELSGLSAEGRARLFMTACGLDCVSGLADPQLEYEVRMMIGDAGVSFAFTDATGRDRGRLEMPWQGSYVLSGVDTEPLSVAPDAQLYTEMRLTGEVTGYGDFARTAPLTARLIYAGHGNMCFQAGGLTHWMLEVTGDGVRYRLFGGLSQP